MIFGNRVAFYTLGCKLNFTETSTIYRKFLDHGYDRVNFQEKADIYVINTCSVTEKSDKKFRHIVRLALKKNPKAFIIAIGCYAQLQPKKLAGTEGVDLVLGTFEKFKITDYLSDLSKKSIGEIHACEITTANVYVPSYSIGDRTRAFLKIQDGCDYKCSYCTIPLARGISRSSTLKKILENVHKISLTGVKEIVLTGINIGDYGKGEFGGKKHEHSFLELISVLDSVEEVERFRISSIEPNLLNDQIIDFIAQSKRFVPHFHIPLQSGSNAILRKMRRRYMSTTYSEKVNKIKNLIPQACIGVDVMVGFPGETDENFIETLNFIRDLDVSYLHVFSYSARQNTEAFYMKEQISKNIQYQRNKILRELSFSKKNQFYKSQIGSLHQVLFEQEKTEGFLYGYTENYIKVKIPCKQAQPNSVKNVFLKRLCSDGVILARTI